eukprot:scaffold23233_cov30-Tisochrysis_lutea.AAC.5
MEVCSNANGLLQTAFSAVTRTHAHTIECLALSYEPYAHQINAQLTTCSTRQYAPWMEANTSENVTRAWERVTEISVCSLGGSLARHRSTRNDHQSILE